jgi:hypothetical protein
MRGKAKGWQQIPRIPAADFSIIMYAVPGNPEIGF